MIEQIIAGAILGAIGGLIGGVFGGSAAGYFSPLGAILGQAGRVAISKCGSQNGRRIGAFCGFLAGVTTAILVEFFQPLILILTAGAIFGFAVYMLERWVADEVAIGLVGGAIGGAALGAAGGYIGVFVLTNSLAL